MNMIGISDRLADVVVEHPSLTRELERLHLDYCCGGQRTIADAARVAGLDPLVVVDELNRKAVPEAPPDWIAMGVAELVEHIEATHHRYVRAELPRLRALLDRLVEVHGQRHPELVSVREAFAELAADLAPHLRSEVMVVFPMIRDLAAGRARTEFDCGSIHNPISVMHAQHDRVGELLATIRDLTDDFAVPPDGCATYEACYRGLEQLEADTHLHVHKENNLLFPAATRIERRLAAAS
ncbi:MAG: iron-sulfur cluster repair di-iron protein [Ilumatobacteraceae bacterium]|nr:iron-sulfur cluster repair di-iron protein [Ilumatobacteraceae bacterium]